MNKEINGKKEGCWEWGYWLNGNLKYKGISKNGIRDGYWEFYWDNGNLFCKGNYKGWKKTGFWERFNEDSTPDHQVFYY